MCYCQSRGKELKSSVDKAEDKVSTLPVDIKAAEEKLTQMKDDIKQHQRDRAAAKKIDEESNAVQYKEAAEFANMKAEADSNLVATAKAIAAPPK